MTTDFETFLRHLPPGSFVPSGAPVSVAEMKVRDVPPDVLPDSYRTFVSTLGPGYWANQSGVVMSPLELYAFDADCWEMEGFVALVENAAGVGDYIAVNPSDPQIDRERPVYYCGHDPFSYALAADSFEDWVRESAQTSSSGWLRYKHLDGARDESYRRYREHRKRERAGRSERRPWWRPWG